MFRRVMLLAAFAVAVPLLAQTKHLISRIDVRGGVPARIVASQTALAAGRTYSDGDLEVAMARLRRLPFIYDAKYTIEGETLVIEVDAVRRLFADVGASGFGYDGDESASGVIGGGGRLFLGGSGGVAEAEVHELVTEADDATSARAAYSHYGIAGTRLFATAEVSQSLQNHDGFDPDPTWRLMAGYPLTVRQTLTASYVDQGYRIRHRLPAPLGRTTQFSSQNTLALGWTWDTTNDPFFARHGATIRATTAWSDASFQFDGIIIGLPGDGVPNTFRTEVDATTFDARADKFWPIGSRGVLFSGAGGYWAENETKTTQTSLPGAARFDVHNYGASVTAGYARNLFDWNTRPTVRQRIELGATYRYEVFEQPVRDVTSNATTIEAAYVLRHPFATVRLNLSYLFTGETLLTAPQGPN